MKILNPRIARWAALLLLSLGLSGCAVIMVAGTAASVAATGASLAIGAGVGAVKLTGAAAGAALDLVIPDSN